MHFCDFFKQVQKTTVFRAVLKKNNRKKHRNRTRMLITKILNNQIDMEEATFHPYTKNVSVYWEALKLW